MKKIVLALCALGLMAGAARAETDPAVLSQGKDLLSYVSPADKGHFTDLLRDTLNTGKVGEIRNWASSTNKKHFKVILKIISDRGQAETLCRNYIQVVSIDGNEIFLQRTACRMENGWKVGSAD